MISKNELSAALKKMILSASGWRGVFADEEESKSKKISNAHNIICACAAYVFADYLKNGNETCVPVVLLGSDTRPTGKAIADAMIPVLLSCGCKIEYAGVTAAPEIMAWARSQKSANTGFIYISASHNPVGHNGIKFGLTDGGVLAAEEAAKLIDAFHDFIEKEDCIEKMENLSSAARPEQIDKILADEKNNKALAKKAYYSFSDDVVWGANMEVFAAVKEGLAEKPLGIVCDFNGSARTVSIDKEYYASLGIKFECINDKPAQIAHRIVPEGESLVPCRELLEKAHARDPSFVLGYVPDCDGDRGNLVIWDDTAGRARALEAQEVFALACAAEFTQLVWTKEYVSGGSVKAAVAINDPTSMRIDKIAKAFGISVFRAEVGEANVVSLARKLRKEGYIVRILGEGSAGGNITHPSAVRDPLNTVMAIVKMLSVCSTNENPSLYKIWCDCLKLREKDADNFTLTDIIASFPPFVTTAAYNKDAILQIKSHDHAELKDKYQRIFLREWEEQKELLKERYGICGWEAIAYNGTAEKRNLTRFGEAGKGGLKVLFFDKEGDETAYIWMRGSHTEPVFRIMADVSGSDTSAERFLLDWQRNMIMEADE